MPCKRRWCQEGHGGGRRLAVRRSGSTAPPNVAVFALTRGEKWGGPRREDSNDEEPPSCCQVSVAALLSCVLQGLRHHSLERPFPPIKAGEPLLSLHRAVSYTSSWGAETPKKSSNAHVFQERGGGSSSLVS